MERRIAKKCENHVQEFKINIKKWLDNSSFSSNEEYSEFLKYLFDYQGISLEKEDFQKRKRVKNMVPHFDRCIANRANGEQCTRRRKQDCEFCGTHFKGTPHGLISNEDNEDDINEKLEVFAEDIQGIVYYIDKFNNVYKTEDILNGKENPQIIAKCEKNNGSYTIPEFGLV